jgi:hypothetical protein
MATVEKKYFIKLQGKDFVQYAGLLDAAHSGNLLSISTEIIQLPTKENGMLAVCKAKVNLDGKEFEGIGDASPESVNKMIQPHSIRMAETRAKARALRDALNIGECSVEELAEDPPAKTPEEKAKDTFNGTDVPLEKNDDAKKMTLTFGKNSGKTLGELLIADRSYVEWLSREAKEEAVRNAAKTLLQTTT